MSTEAKHDQLKRIFCWHLLLASCAVFSQKLLHRTSHTSEYRQHCMYTLLQNLEGIGPNTPASDMLVEA